MKKYIISVMALAVVGGLFGLHYTKTEAKEAKSNNVNITKIISAKADKASDSYKISKSNLGQKLTDKKSEVNKPEQKPEVSYTNTIAFGQTVLPVGKLTMNSAHDVPSVFCYSELY